MGVDARGRRRLGGILVGLALWVATAGRTAESAGPVAFLPIENHAGHPVPLRDLEAQLRETIEARGVELLPQDDLARFMAKSRVRYTGGLSAEVAKGFREDARCSAVIVSAIEAYDEADPPRIALISRLVSTEDRPSILWIDSVGIAGSERPGFLSRGVVHEIAPIRDAAFERIAASLAQAWGGGPEAGKPEDPADRFGPRRSYRHAEGVFGGAAPLRLAVMPFSNESGRRNAGEVMTLHFVRELWSAGIDVVEPGLVRQALLQGRLIQQGGISFPQAELVRALLEVDVVLTGSVKGYQDAGGAWPDPMVNFTVRGIDAARRRVVWTSISYNRGSDGVFFFEVGKVHTAHALASNMVRAVVRQIASPPKGSAGG